MNEKHKRIEELYTRERERLFSIALKLLMNWHDAEDAVEEVYYAIIRMKRDFSNFDEEQMDRYLTTVVKNKAYDIIYRRKLENIYKKTVIRIPYIEDAAYRKICAEERKEYVSDKVEKLPEAYKDTMEKFVLEEMSIREIEKETHENRERIKKRVARGKKILEKNMKDYKQYF